MEMASTNGANAMRRFHIENANQRAAYRRRSHQFAFLGECNTGNGTIVRGNDHFWLFSDLLLQLNEEKITIRRIEPRFSPSVAMTGTLSTIRTSQTPFGLEYVG